MTRRSGRRPPVVPGLLAAALVVGCGSPGAGPDAGVPAAVTAPAAACRALATAAPAGASSGGAGSGSTDAPPPQGTPASGGAPASGSATAPGGAPAPHSAGRTPLPDVRLPCLGGVGTVQLRQLRGPAVVNLWASWCRPCRDELPTLQRYAQQTAGRVSVVGVNTADGSAGRDAIVADLGLTFPVLVDERAVLRAELGRIALPVTVFVDANGRVAHVHNDVVPDLSALHRLAGQHLGAVAG